MLERHTPKPWRLTDGGIIDNNPPRGHAGIEIANVYGMNENETNPLVPEQTQALANGVLMVASPKLLAAIRAILVQVVQGPILERDACIAQALASFAEATSIS